MEEVLILQEVSCSEVNFGSVICFKNRIENVTQNDISDISIVNCTTIEFEKKYYEFEKSRSDIDVYNEDGYIKIQRLRAGDYVNIYISTYITDIFDEFLVSFIRVDYRENENNFKTIRSNENTIKFLGADFSAEGFKIKASKNFADYNDIYNVKIEISNNGNREARNVELYDILSNKTKFIRDSLYINGSFIDIGSDISIIQLSDLVPLQKIMVSFKVKIIENKQVHEIIQCGTLVYKELYNGNESIERVVKSNICKIKIRKVEITNFCKNIDKPSIKKGEKIHFNINIENTGNVNLLDIIVKNEKERCVEFAQDSFKIDSVKYDINPYEGIKIDYINSSEGVMIEYDVIAIEKSSAIYEKCILNYKYLSSDGNMLIEEQREANVESYEILDADLVLCKELNKKMLYIGERVKCYINIENKGNIEARNIILSDSLLNGLEFINASLEINSKKVNIDNIQNIKIDEILPGEIKKITYDLKAINITNYTNEKNMCKIIYEFLVDDYIYKEKALTFVSDIPIMGAIINSDTIKKFNDKKYVSIFDEINIELEIANKGNEVAKQIKIIEELPQELEFIKSSVVINGLKSHYDITKGIVLADLNIEDNIKISYKLLAKNTNFEGHSFAKTYVKYLSNKSDGTFKENIVCKTSDEIFIKGAYINNKNGVFIRQSQSLARSLDIIEVRLFFKNTGNVEAFNVILEDCIDGMKIVSDILVNNKKTTYNNGYISIDSIKSGESVELIYKAKIEKSYKRELISHTNISYNYYMNGSGVICQGNGESNILKIDIYNADLMITESINKTKVSFFDDLMYNLYITNIGNVNLKNINLILDFDDEIKIKVSEFNVGGTNFSCEDVKQAVNIGAIASGESTLVSVKYNISDVNKRRKMFIVPIIKGEYIHSGNRSCEIEKVGIGKIIFINDNNLIVEKKTKNEVYIKGDLIEYFITIKNNGTSIAQNIIIKDDDLNFVLIESININGIKYKNFKDHIYINEINQGDCVFINYKCDYRSYDLINTDVTVKASFKDQDGNYEDKRFKSINKEIFVKKSDVDMILTSDTQHVSYNDEIKIITTIINKGNLDIFDISINEIKDESLQFKKQDVYMGAVKLNVGNSLEIPILKSKEIIEITKYFLYNNYKYKESVGFESMINYTLKLSDNNTKRKQILNNIILQVNNDNSKSIDLQSTICKKEEGDISEVIDLIATAEITNFYIIRTIKNNIYKNNILTGYKLMIRGNVEYKIEYIEDSIDEAIRILKGKEKFTTTVVMPECFDESDDLDVSVNTSESFYRLLDKKNVLTNVSLNIDIII